MSDDDTTINEYRPTEDSPDEERPPTVEEGILDKVPEWVVSLGAGFLLTATLITTILTGIVTYSLITGDYTGPFRPLRKYSSRLILVELQLLFVTLFQAVGTYFARRRSHWGTVLLSCIFGSLVFITIPFTLPAFVLLALGKRQFRMTDNAHNIDI
jgi:Na+/proline symporter